MMRRFRIAALAAVLLIASAASASADPVTDLIIAGLTYIGTGAATAAAIASAVVTTAVSVGLSYVTTAIFGSGSSQPQFGVTGTIQTGGVVPRSFIVGHGPTDGSLSYVGYWGNSGKTPNAYLTMVIALMDLSAAGNFGITVNGAKGTIDTGTSTSQGHPVTEFRQSGTDYLWVRFVDGTQSAADSWLVSTFGSDPQYPYSSAMIGKGVAYAIVTALVNEQLFSGFPTYRFEMDGVKLYDRRQDSTAGGSGSQRWATPSTWAFTENPMVIAENVLRGMSYGGSWFYGLQALSDSRLPASAWFAAQNECDLLVDNHSSGTEPQYRCGGEILVNIQPADTLDELNKSCNARLAEIGGIYKPLVGAAAGAVLSFTDADILATEAQSDTPFPSLASLINGITAHYPDPTQGWQTIDAPPLLTPDLETADGDRELISDINYGLVPFAEQVQRLMKSALGEARRFRQHAIVLGPIAWPVEPLDSGSWTSDRNGYTDKLFLFKAIQDQSNCDVGTGITEVDPSDYDWNPSTDYQPVNSAPVIFAQPPAQAMSGWAVSGETIVGDGGREQAGIELSWDTTGIDDVNGVQYQVRLASDSSSVLAGETDHFADGSGVISQNILSDTAYQARGRYRSASGNRSFDWSSWLSVTTPNILITIPDGSITGAKIASGLELVLTVATTGALDHTISNVGYVAADQKLYRWDGSAWIASVPTADLTGTVVTAQIADTAITTAKLQDAAVIGEKIAIGDFTNLITNPLFVDGAGNPSAAQYTGAIAITVLTNYAGTGANAGVNYNRDTFFQHGGANAFNGFIPMVPGQQYYVEAGDSYNPSIFDFSGGIHFVDNPFSPTGHSFTPAWTSPAGLNGFRSGTITVPATVSGGATTAWGQAWWQINTFSPPPANPAFIFRPVLRKSAGAELLVDGSITAAKVVTGTLTATQIAAATITAAQMAAGSITAGKIAANAVTSGTVAANAITAGTLDVGAINANTIFAANVVLGSTILSGESSKGFIKVQTGSDITVAANSRTEIIRKTVTSLGGNHTIALTFCQTGKADSGSYGTGLWWAHIFTVGGSSGGLDAGSGSWFMNDSGQLRVTGFGQMDPGTFAYGDTFDVVLQIEGDTAKRPNVNNAYMQIISQR